jgi:hypothetical protein
MSDPEDVVNIFNSWAAKFVKNMNPEFRFEAFLPVLQLAKELISKRVTSQKIMRL